LLPKCEQTAIADLLSTWDAAIEKTERLIAAKERWLDALKQDLLTGSKRIKGFKGNWRRYRLSDVLTEHGELSSGKEEVFSVSVHKGLINQVEHLGRSFAAKDLANYNLVKPGDIVYTKSPTGDFPYGIIKQSRVDVPVIVSPLYGVFAPRDRHLGTFLDFYFESPIRTKNYLNPIIQKGAKNTINITNKTFLSNKLYLPTCAEETKAIADTLNSTRQEINLLKKQAEAYRRQKRGLMQKLLTGGWRVKTSKEVVNG
jgi:type I restriction enzyme S subunit